MSVETSPTPSATPSAHELVARRLKERKSAPRDLSAFAVVEHMASRETFLAGPLSYEEHRAYRNLRRFEEIQHETAGKGSQDPPDRSRSDRYLLERACCTEDGTPLGADIATDLLETPTYGPDTHRLISEAERANPPREELVREVFLLWQSNRQDKMMWRLLFECGLGRALLDSMSTHATLEEKAWATAQIAKAEEVVEVAAVYFQAEEVARDLEMQFREEAGLPPLPPLAEPE